MKPYYRITLCIVMILSALAGTAVTANQTVQTQSITMERSGAEVELLNLDKAEFFPNGYVGGPSSDGGDLEYVRIKVGTSTVFVYIMDQVDADLWHSRGPEDLAQIYWRGGELLINELDNAKSIQLARGKHTLDFEQYFYSEFHSNFDGDLDIVSAIYGSPETVTQDMEIARNNISVNTAPIFPEADLPYLDSIIEGTLDIVPTVLQTDTYPLGDPADLGFSSETQWESPTTGNTISWDGMEWAFPFQHPGGTYHNYPKNGVVFHLYETNNLAESNLFLHEHGAPLDEQEAYDILASSRQLEIHNASGQNLTLIDWIFDGSTGIAVYHGTLKYGEPIIQISVIQRIENRSGKTMRVHLALIAKEENVGEMWNSFAQNVQIDGLSLDGLWNGSDIQTISSGSQVWNVDHLPADDSNTSQDTSNSENDATEVTRTPRTASTPEAITGDQTLIAEHSGVTIDLGPSGDAEFYHEGHYTTESNEYHLESFTVDYGTTVVIIDVMDGDVNVDDYMLTAEADIAATYDYMDWLGGAWSNDHAWDVYSGVYKLDYREHVYLDLFHDPESGLYFGIGLYGSAEDLSTDIPWLQSNITIGGMGILAETDVNLIESVIDDSSQFAPEPVPMPESTVEDWSDAGLVSETEWQSPFTNTSFTWDGTNLVFPFVQSDALDATDGVTTLELRTFDRRGEIKLFTAEVEHTPADWVANYTSDDYLETQEATGQPVTILESAVTDETGSVIQIYHTDFGDPVIVIVDVYVNDDGVTILTEIAASPDDIAGVYATFWDSVQSNGDFYPLTWTVEEIENLEID